MVLQYLCEPPGSFGIALMNRMNQLSQQTLVSRQVVGDDGGSPRLDPGFQVTTLCLRKVARRNVDPYVRRHPHQRCH